MSIDVKAREQVILDAAAELIVRQGYDKTTMSDVADAVGLHRTLIYVHFSSKEDLLEALITREMRKYGELWIEHLEADPEGGTVASMYRSISYALKHTPFMAAIVTRDEGTFGKYVRKPGNIIEDMQTEDMTRELLQTMQDAGVIRQDVNIPAMAYIMDVVSYGLVGLTDVPNITSVPPFDELMETVAEMFDRMLTPEDGGNLKAGKDLLRQLAAEARANFEQIEQAEEEES